MKLQIDNFDGAGLRDYTAAIDGTRLPQVTRQQNKPYEMHISLVASTPDFVVPAVGARVLAGKTNGQDVFSGYLKQSPAFEYLGWGEQGPVYRYDLLVESDEAQPNEKRLPNSYPFANRSAGGALRQLTQDLVGASVDTSSVQNLDMLAGYAPDPQRTWSQHAAEIAVQSRASYRLENAALLLAPLGQNVYALNQTDPNFSPEGLQLKASDGLINDVTVIGEMEPEDYVKDYFVGDGLTEKFYLSQNPFVKTGKTLLDEEYTEAALDPTSWTVNDPAGAVSISAGKLQIAGGTGVDGATTVEFIEQAELGGALVLQHGDVMLNAPSSGVIGGLYPGTVSISGCLAGFLVTPNGSQSNIQALVNGAATGSVITTVSGHHYVFTTRIYSGEIFRRQQTFHSSVHPAGAGIGGAQVAAEVRIVLEVHEIDPNNPATEVAPATVLWDDMVGGAPGFCTYALINSSNLQCSVAFTWIEEAPDVEVRSALPGQSYTSCLVGDLKDGAECTVTSSATLEFFSAYVPAANQLIEVYYRGSGRALARVTNPASIAAEQQGTDNGVRAAVRHVKLPLARTEADCENAALAILDDSGGPIWTGEYQVWSDFLPGAATDIFPGDGLALNIPACGVAFQAVVQRVDIGLRDLEGDHCFYKVAFTQAADPAFSFEFEAATIKGSLVVTSFTNAQIGNSYLADLTAAEITQVTSTTVSVDAGVAPPNGGGFEVRWSDAGWGAENDRNLVGRFGTQTFTIPRLSRVQTCYVQQYDGSVPPKYSRYSAALHVDYPL